MMKHWTTNEAIASQGGVWRDFVYGLFGLYAWELVISMDFDWAYMTRKRAFRWPLVFYFSNRYLMLGTFVGVVLWTNLTNPVDCLALYTSVQVFANLSLGLSGINLSLRTMAVWNMSRYVIAPLVLMIIGQLTLLLVSAIPLSVEYAEHDGCITYGDNVVILTAIVYTMCENFIILVLTAWGLVSQLGRLGSSQIATIIFTDGLIFFLIAFTVEAVAVVFILLDLNPVMQTMANILPTTISSVVACRAVRRLANYTQGEAEALGASRGTPGRTGQRGTMALMNDDARLNVLVHCETHVQTHVLPPEPAVLKYDLGESPTKRSLLSDLEANEVIEIKRPDF
ncbi:hypothetical protein CERSUDRAFT_139418 [Gelatoporia subvermispora B]|uniref:Uncharacterized protein n=1 Tax=Ceriporiopsis subvermispora (strain B) TaxID=914234 RepID=M2QEV3_CERS8|nr:hypothetical protein CERSUDRAFT_139418 [Gelatoporia subvermispora B]